MLSLYLTDSPVSSETPSFSNFPFLSSNIPSSPAYGVFISQLIRYAGACSSYECFILRVRRLSSKLLKQGYLAERKSSLRKFYCRYGDLIQQYEVSLSRMLNDILILDQQWLPNQSDFPPSSWHWYRAWPSPIMSGFHGAFATGVACQQGTLTFPDTWFRPHWGTCLYSNCWDQIPRTCYVFTRLFTSNTPWYFLDFALKMKRKVQTLGAFQLYIIFSTWLLYTLSEVFTPDNFLMMYATFYITEMIYNTSLRAHCIKEKVQILGIFH